MGLLGNLLVGGFFLGLLASDDDSVRVPKSDWNDAVGESICTEAGRHISKYNTALKDCRSSLYSVKTKAESKALEVNFNSKKDALQWQAKLVDDVKVNSFVEDVERILRG